MDRAINVLVLSCGTRVKLVEYFRDSLKDIGNVYATDCSNLAPALYVADKYFITKRIDEEGYIEEILELCAEYSVTAVLSLIDPELSLLAQHKESFQAIGSELVLSESSVIEMCFDKYTFSKELTAKGIPTVPTYINYDDFVNDLHQGIVSFPVYVKPRWGSASLNNMVVETLDRLKNIFTQYSDMIVQPFIKGKEFGADAYVDMRTGQLTSLFIKEKLRMRAGETDKSISVINSDILGLVDKVVASFPLNGVFDVDLFETNGIFLVSEINPRFGGGYPHAYECGVNIPAQIIKNLKNEVNQPTFFNYREGVYMMKYSDVILINDDRGA